MALIQDNIRPCIVKSEISDDVKFEINGNFMRELRRKIFKGTDDEDAHEHVRRVLEIADLFHFLGVTHDAIMLRVFPITITGLTLRWKNRLSAGALPKKDKAVGQSKYIVSLEETIIKYCDESIKKQSANDEWVRKFIENTDLNIRALDATTKYLQVKAYQLTQMVLTNAGKRVKAKTKIGKKDMKEPVPRNLLVVQPYVPPTPFSGYLKKQKDNPYKTRKTVCMIKSPENIHKKKAQEDEWDIDDSWKIMAKDVERLRHILTPIVHTLPNFELVVQPYMPIDPVRDAKVKKEEEHDYNITLQDGIMQPLTPKTVHITLYDDDCVAPATNPILDKHLNEFFDTTGVNENADGNFIEDTNEISIITDVEFEIQILLNKVSQLPKSSNKTGKTRRDMKSHQRGYEFAQDTLVKSSTLAIIIWNIEQHSGESLVLILLLGPVWFADSLKF
ncbi:hypothetical protein Tco_1293439 [Tanacetum coccineum]